MLDIIIEEIKAEFVKIWGIILNIISLKLFMCINLD